MSKTKIWTYGVAYLSLVVGAGVSIAGNVADTYRTSLAVGHVPDGLDITISAFWPAAVLLAIEMFVSTLWPHRPAMQAVRWFGSLAIGFVAMYSSWHHLADLLASRGQDILVANLGPLAIDGLAIMATALILSARVARTLATPDVQVATMATDGGHPVDTMATGVAMATDGGHPVDTMATDILAEDDRWTSEDDGQLASWMDRLASSVDSSTTPATPLDIVATEPVATPAPRQGVVDTAVSVPDEARQMLQVWKAERDNGLVDIMAKGDVDKLVAGYFGVTARTARRWRYAVAKQD